MDLVDPSGQIIATSHEFSPQMVVKSKGNPLISGKPRLVKYYNLAQIPIVFIMKKNHPPTSNLTSLVFELGRIPAHPHPDPDYLAYLDSLYTPLEGHGGKPDMFSLTTP